MLAAAVVDADQQRRARLQRWADIRPTPAPAAGAGGSTDPLPMATDAVNDDSDADGDDFDFDFYSDSDYELDFEPPEDDEDAEVISYWKKDDNYRFSQRATSKVDSFDKPTLTLDGYETKSIFDFAKHFLPMKYMDEIAKKMQLNGEAKWNHGKDRHFMNWRVTTADLLMWIGCWIYMLSFHHPGGRRAYFQEVMFGPTHDLKKWLKIGCPGSDRGILWFESMHACFELPTYRKLDDPFNATRRWWNCLREAFFLAVVCSWIICIDESMVKWLGRGMPGFMVVARKPTPKGTYLPTYLPTSYLQPPTSYLLHDTGALPCLECHGFRHRAGR